MHIDHSRNPPVMPGILYEKWNFGSVFIRIRAVIAREPGFVTVGGNRR